MSSMLRLSALATLLFVSAVAAPAVADEAVADDAVADEAVADEAVADEAVADEAASGALPEEVVAAPAKPPAPGLTLPAGKINIAVNLEMNMSKDSVLKPLSLAPDVSYGVNPDLTVMLVHSRFLTSGFRGAAGGGLCLSGTDGKCANVYDNVGGEALYSLVRGEVAVAANVGVHALSLDAGFYSAKLGAKIKYTAGKVGVMTSPSLYVAMTERDTNVDKLWVPVIVGYTVSPKVWAALGTGFKGPLDGFGDSWQLAVGALGTYKIDAKLTVGASLIFGQIAGGQPDPEPDPATVGPDFRWVQTWVSYTL